MARVTVEDCVEVVANRFELVALASERARNIAAGSHITVERDNDKNAVIALREIAERTVSVDLLREAIIQQQQRYGNQESPNEEFPDEEMADSELLEEIKAFSHQGEITESDTDSFSFDDENLDVDD